MKLIDCHCHLDFDCFASNRAQLLAQCGSAGISAIILAATQKKYWQRLWQLSHSTKQPELYACIGLHPYFISEHQPEDLQSLKAWLTEHKRSTKLRAIGEIGLDFYIPNAERELQLFYFTEQLKLAQQFELPAVLHVRKAHAEVIATLKRYPLSRGGMVHAFSGSYEQAQEYMRLGLYFGIGGAYSWPNARKLRSVLPRLPLDRILLETDSPDMLPAFATEQPNTPLNLPVLCELLADLLNITPTQLAEQTTQNAKRLFRLN